MESSKTNIIDLRVILLGASNVGKKSIAQRLKILKSTETKEISLKDFGKRKIINKSQKREYITEEEKKEQKKEEKRINLMRCIKIFRMELNSIHLSFYPCADAENLYYDYEPKEEDDENYEFEKEYKISIRKLMNEIKGIIIRPSDDSRAQVEILFLLCFDLSDFSSFENLIIYFSQTNKKFKLTQNDFKLVLIGTKIDMKKTMNNDEKENFESFKNQLNLPYYEISTLMFFNFENFFEKLILDNYTNIFPFFSSERNINLFHDILHTKNDFTKTKRDDFQKQNDVPGANKYYNNVYEYPKTKRELLKIFKNKTRFNKKIFINKQSILFPPIKYMKEEMNSDENNKKNSKEIKDEYITVNWDSIKNDKIQSALELNSNIKGYSFGIRTNKSLGLKKQRDNLRNLKEKEIINKLDGYIVSGSQVLPIKSYRSSSSIEEYQEKYEQNRNEKKRKDLEERMEINEIKKERHDIAQLKNSKSFNQKVFQLKEKEKKYENIRTMIEKERNNKKYNTIDVDNKYENNYYEPKGKFYDPVSSISTNKGFTFGQKLEVKYEKRDDPDYPIFQDDFEKLIEKNKKRPIIKSIGQRLPVYKTEEVGDSSYVMEKQKEFEKKRRRFRQQLFSGFFYDRKDKIGAVMNKKKLISENQEKILKEQIKKSYKTDENYLIRDINYNQIESSSPKYTITGKHSSHNNIFNPSKYDENDYYSHERFATISGKEINYKDKFSNINFKAIFPRYPAFSFGNSKRFDFFMDKINKSNEKNKNKNKSNERYDDNYNNFDIFKSQDAQSFLMAQTSMGTDEKLKMDKNDNPGPGMYKIKGFADDIASRGSKINLTRIKIREKEKDIEIDKERRAKLREEWINEKKNQLKMGIREYYNSKLNNQINNDENNNSIDNNNH